MSARLIVLAALCVALNGCERRVPQTGVTLLKVCHHIIGDLWVDPAGNRYVGLFGDRLADMEPLSPNAKIEDICP